MFNFILDIPFLLVLLDEINTGEYFYVIPILIFIAFVIINEIRKAIRKNKEDN